eukprot:1756205-Rhodomonas_salina.2
MTDTEMCQAMVNAQPLLIPITTRTLDRDWAPSPTGLGWWVDLIRYEVNIETGVAEFTGQLLSADDEGLTEILMEEWHVATVLEELSEVPLMVKGWCLEQAL